MTINADTVFEEMKTNQQKLNACEGHDFRPVVNKQYGFTTRYECEHCGGSVDPHAEYWYEKGRAHGEAQRA